MNEPQWLDTAIVLDVHTEQLALFGGADGIGDLGLLESALGRALNKFAYGERDLAALAAAYGFGIARNHPFIDGNKRTAFAAIGLFLFKNGYLLNAHDAEATQAMFALAAGDLTEEELVEWIRRYSSAGKG